MQFSSTAPSSSESEPGLLADNVATTISSAAGQEVVAADGSRYVLTPINFVPTPVPAPAAEASDSVGQAGSSVETGDEEFIDPQKLDLSTALQLVAGQNPQVAFAHQRIAEASARLDAAEALWLPTIRAGISLNRHEGTLQNSNGQIVDVSRNSLQGGFGDRAVGAGTNQTPGLSAEFHLSDAVFASADRRTESGSQQLRILEHVPRSDAQSVDRLSGVAAWLTRKKRLQPKLVTTLANWCV